MIPMYMHVSWEKCAGGIQIRNSNNSSIQIFEIQIEIIRNLITKLAHSCKGKFVQKSELVVFYKALSIERFSYTVYVLD